VVPLPSSPFLTPSAPFLNFFLLPPPLQSNFLAKTGLVTPCYFAVVFKRGDGSVAETVNVKVRGPRRAAGFFFQLLFLLPLLVPLLPFPSPFFLPFVLLNNMYVPFPRYSQASEGKSEPLPLFSAGDHVAGEVRVTPLPGRRVDHLGVKVQLVGRMQIGEE
jgi:hypothetical protein